MSSLVEIGPVVLEKKIFLNFLNVFSLFRHYLPLENGGALHLNKLESLHQRMLCAKKGQGPSFEQTGNPFTQECIVPAKIG